RTVRRKDRRVEALATVLSQLKPGSPLVASVADEAAGIARSIEQRDRRDAALDAIVQDLADLDPDRAMELALSISRPKLRGRAMRCVVRHMAKRGPERALAIARGTKHIGSTDGVKNMMAWELAETAPDKAMKLTRSISEPARRTWALFRVGLTGASRSKTRLRKAHGRLLALAQRIRDPRQPDATPSLRAFALAAVARAWVKLAILPPRALQAKLMSVVRDLDCRDTVRVTIAEAVVERDPEAALGLIEAIDDPWMRYSVEERAVVVLAATDPQRALSVAQSGRCKRYRHYVLESAAAALAAADSDGTLAAIQSVRSRPTRMSLLYGWAKQVTKQDPDRALAVARRERDDHVRWHMTRGIATALGEADLRRAVRVARTIPDLKARGDALFAVAWAALP
ncbi:MAG: hypothetical protein JSV65_12155, partial [Armatimonadota bacterium]